MVITLAEINSNVFMMTRLVGVGSLESGVRFCVGAFGRKQISDAFFTFNYLCKEISYIL
jgi:hypothetical protein